MGCQSQPSARLVGLPCAQALAAVSEPYDDQVSPPRREVPGTLFPC